MKDIIVYGSGGHAKVIIDIIEREEEYKILGLIDDNRKIGESVFGYKILGDKQKLLELKKNIVGGIVAVGDNFTRGQVVANIKEIIPDFCFISAIHPYATIARGVTIGAGSAVMAGAVINSGTTIGEHCIVNSNASIDHDCEVFDYAAVLPSATLGGNVKLGAFSVIALGANVIHGITIGGNTVVGAGSTVLDDLSPNVLAFGTPCQTLRPREFGEKYL